MRAHLINALLAIVFSVLIWAAVGAQLSQTATLKVDYTIDVPPDVTVSYQGRRETDALVIPVEVVVTGPREVVSRFAERRLAAKHEFLYTQAQFQEDVRSGQLRSQAVRDDVAVVLDRKLEVTEVRPAVVELVFSQVVIWDPQVKPPQAIGKPQPGYRVDKVVVPPPSRVRVRGPSTVREKYPGPFDVAPVDVTGMPPGLRQELEGTLQVPPEAHGVTADGPVKVLVDIVAEPITKKFTLPVQILVKGERNDRVQMNFSVEPQGTGWEAEVELRGPEDLLAKLRDELDRERLNKTGAANLPRAYISAEEFPAQGGQNTVEVAIVGLPEGVTVVGAPKFPIRVTREEGPR